MSAVKLKNSNCSFDFDGLCKGIFNLMPEDDKDVIRVGMIPEVWHKKVKEMALLKIAELEKGLAKKRIEQRVQTDFDFYFEYLSLEEIVEVLSEDLKSEVSHGISSGLLKAGCLF